MKIWVDDVREAPKGYRWIKSVYEFKNYFEDFNDINEISLDHDAGEYSVEGGDYIEILNYLDNIYNSAIIYFQKIEDKECMKIADNISNIKFHLHSQNPVGVENMRRIIERNGWTEVK